MWNVRSASLRSGVYRPGFLFTCSGEFHSLRADSVLDAQSRCTSTRGSWGKRDCDRAVPAGLATGSAGRFLGEVARVGAAQREARNRQRRFLVVGDNYGLGLL